MIRLLKPSTRPFAHVPNRSWTPQLYKPPGPVQKYVPSPTHLQPVNQQRALVPHQVISKAVQIYKKPVLSWTAIIDSILPGVKKVISS